MDYRETTVEKTPLMRNTAERGQRAAASPLSFGVGARRVPADALLTQPEPVIVPVPDPVPDPVPAPRREPPPGTDRAGIIVAGPGRRARLRSRRLVAALVAVVLVAGAVTGGVAIARSQEDDSSDPGIVRGTAMLLERAQQALVEARRKVEPPAPNGHAYVPRPEPAAAPQGYAAPAVSTAPVVRAPHTVVIDAKSGTVLWAQGATVPVPNASTTKILTALAVLRYTDAAQMVPIDQVATSVGEREINLVPGEQRSVSELLGAMLVVSANDAATALGQFVGAGNVPAFATLATNLAHRLGAKTATMVTPSGLDAAGHAFSALDLAVLARAGLADPVFRELVVQQQFQIPPAPGSPFIRSGRNKNKLLRLYPGAIGVKTGETRSAGNCLVGAAARNGSEFVVVALHSPDPTADDAAMLDWAFANYESVLALPRGGRLRAPDGSRVRSVAPLWVTVPIGQRGNVQVRATTTRVIASLQGRTLGWVPAA